jgi:transposase InsO family protein
MEFVQLASKGEIGMRELCRRFRISAPTGYKWRHRYEQESEAGLEDRSHRPHQQPRRSSAGLERRVIELRNKHPAWGGRKIRKLLERAGERPLPSASTVSAILRRHNLLDLEHGLSCKPPQRFEYPAPNLLWQMDFKGHFAIRAGRCHPLTVLDDHSRYALGLRACADERELTVRQQLSDIFRVYGLPRRMLTDNGAPFGTGGGDSYSTLEVWLMRLAVQVIHGRVRHPQTQGKDERFHRTIVAEVLRDREFHDLLQVQLEFDQWLYLYNYERPHESLGMEPPASRFHPSQRPFPEQLPRLEYAPGQFVRRVQRDAVISFHNRSFKIGKAFVGLPVALRPTTTDGVFDVFFATTQIHQIDLRETLDNV